MNCKLLKTIGLLFYFFVVTLHAGAQQESDAPTKEDAIKFMNKIALEYLHIPERFPFAFQGVVYDTIYFSLEGKVLTQTVEYHSWGGFAQRYFYYKSIHKVDLSSVFFGQGNDNSTVASANKKGDILVSNCARDFNGLNAYKKYGKFEFKHCDEPKNEDSFDCGPFFKMVQGPQKAVDDHYLERFSTAFTFLVKACGGGKKKIDTNDKF